ncbi:hypothetical protein E2986_12464 [Frieseomelitta varia]|uniref:Uncharacterized protein n=1 Tax=Frieseomelitta varia TaxID=561572 RepID=A0A833W496_9HYME|nr:hypothetical protein E2986_12464 [Frieseomelitta varia]
MDTQKVNYRTKLSTQKPICVQEYNRFMGIVDKTDMVISILESIRKNVSIWNSYVLYKYVSSKELPFAEFHLKLIKQIFGKYLQTSNIYQGKRNRMCKLSKLKKLRKPLKIDQIICNYSVDNQSQRLTVEYRAVYTDGSLQKCAAVKRMVRPKIKNRWTNFIQNPTSVEEHLVVTIR